MLMTEESARVRKIVTDSLAELLLECLKFKAQFTVEALFAITLDSAQEFHFTVSENVKIDLPNHAECAASPVQQKQQCAREKDEVALIGSESEPMSVDREVCNVRDVAIHPALRGGWIFTSSNVGALKKLEVNNHDNGKTQTGTDVQNHAGSDIPSTNCMIEERSEPLVEDESPSIAPEPMSVDDEVCHHGNAQEDLKKSRVNNDETQALSPGIKAKQASSDDVQNANVINIVPESSEWNAADDHDSYSLPVPLEMTAEEFPSNDVEDKPVFIKDQPPTEEKPGCVKVVNDGTSLVESTPAPSNSQCVVYLDICHAENYSSYEIRKHFLIPKDPELRQATSPKIPRQSISPTVKQLLDDRRSKNSVNSSEHHGHRTAKHDTHVEQKSRNATVPAECKVIQVDGTHGTAREKINKIEASTSIAVPPQTSTCKVIPLDSKPGVSLPKHKSRGLTQAVQTANPSPQALTSIAVPPHTSTCKVIPLDSKPGVSLPKHESRGGLTQAVQTANPSTQALTSIAVPPHTSTCKVIPLDSKQGVSLPKHKSRGGLTQAVQTANPSPKATRQDLPNFVELFQIRSPKNVVRKSIDDRVAQKILLFKGPMVSVPGIQRLFRSGRRPCTNKVKHIMTKLVAEKFGRMNCYKIGANRGNGSASVFNMFYKKNPTELTFPIAEYEVSKEEYVKNFYDSYSQGWDQDKHKGEPKCSSWS